MDKKVTDLIKKGMEKFPNDLRWGFFDMAETAACVIGCAVWGAYEVSSVEFVDRLYEDYPVFEQWYTHPAPGASKIVLDWQLNEIIVDLMDDKRWTRQQVVEWLESEGL